MIGYGARLLAAALLGLVLGSVPGVADQAKPAPVTSVSLEVKAVRDRIDAVKVELDQREMALQNRQLSDAELQNMRQQVDPLAETVRGLVEELNPRLDASRARLEQLGPKPKEGQPEESADVARDRSEREAAVAELDETQRLARTLLVQASQITTQIVDRRRASFTRALFEQGSSILSPSLWADVIQALPREWRALRTVLSDAFDSLGRNATLGALLLVGLALGAAVALYGGRRYVATRLVSRDPSVLDPSRRNRLLAAIGVLMLGAVPAVIGSWTVWVAFDSMDLVPSRIEGVVQIVLRAAAFIAFVHALVDAIMAPGHGSWRLIPLTEATSSRILNYTVAIASVMMAGKVVESVNQAVAAAIPVTIITRSVFALACVLILGQMLRGFANAAAQDEACLGPHVTTETDPLRWARNAGYLTFVVVLGSVLTGYVAFAWFLVEQTAWIGILVSIAYLALGLADEFIGNSLKGGSRIATALQANMGVRRRSVEQAGVLLNGLARLAVVLFALMLALAPWGIESSDLVSSMRAAFFGFQVGDVTISLSAIVISLLLFTAGFALTRIVQRWLDTTFLPATELDAGLRNSIRTAFGYFGIFVAAAIAFSYLGLSLDRIAIVAGALSVGIGFGLQSIVNNFVSGLILLWERPIRVGDLVVVGDGEGYVRRINVRATEIETFDRSTVVVPNSNLISGVVRNRVRTDRTGRVLVSVPVPRASDPDRVADIMRTCALAHREVMSEPAPRVLFKKIGESTIEFDLVCFVDEIETSGRVSSDLMFSIYRGLREAGIGHPIPDSSAIMQGLARVEDSLEHIAEAIEGESGDAKPVTLPQPALPIGVTGQPIVAPRRPVKPKGAS
ncbi:MAG TPA: DUF3772 domain-containing protein [Microvirga sp.]|jgi:small-conductance mechanosensitive channel